MEVTTTAASGSEVLDTPTLVARIIMGERDAENELVRRYSPGLAIILRRATGDPSVAEDISQDSFRIALEKIRKGELREPAKLSGFICQLARNLAALHFRRLHQSKTTEDAAAKEVPDVAPSHLDHLLVQERVRLVRQVLSELRSKRDREILYRFYIAEEDKNRICADLKLASLHFNRVLYRARERYRQLFLQVEAKLRASGCDSGSP